MSLSTETQSQTTGTKSFGGMQARSEATLNNARVAIRNLDFFYGDNRALKGINLDLPDRQVTGMIGPSGCGKSTLGRCMIRLVEPTLGRIVFDSQDVTRLTDGELDEFHPVMALAQTLADAVDPENVRWWAWAVTVFAALTMVSNFPFYSFKTINLRRSVPFVVVFLIVLFFVSQWLLKKLRRANERRQLLTQTLAEVDQSNTSTVGGPSGTPNPVIGGGMVSLSVTATDNFGHAPTYAWTVTCAGLPSNGSFDNATLAAPTWTNVLETIPNWPPSCSNAT